MTLDEELAIVSQVLALRRAGKIPPVWAIDGRYRIGLEYENADHYTAEGLRLVVENGGVQASPPRLLTQVRPGWGRQGSTASLSPAISDPKRAAPPRTAWLIPRARHGQDDAELVARVKSGHVDGLNPWQIRRGEYVARRERAACANPL
jgi:hypothetical protein